MECVWYLKTNISSKLIHTKSYLSTKENLIYIGATRTVYFILTIDLEIILGRYLLKVIIKLILLSVTKCNFAL